MYGHYTTAVVIMEYMMPPYTTTWSSPKTTPRFQIITWNNIQPPKIPKLRSIPQPTNPTHRALHQHESLFATHKISSANQLGNWFPSALMSLFSCADPKQVSSLTQRFACHLCTNLAQNTLSNFAISCKESPIIWVGHWRSAECAKTMNSLNICTTKHV